MCVCVCVVLSVFSSVSTCVESATLVGRAVKGTHFSGAPWGGAGKRVTVWKRGGTSVKARSGFSGGFLVSSRGKLAEAPLPRRRVRGRRPCCVDKRHQTSLGAGIGFDSGPRCPFCRDSFLFSPAGGICRWVIQI